MLQIFLLLIKLFHGQNLKALKKRKKPRAEAVASRAQWLLKVTGDQVAPWSRESSALHVPLPLGCSFQHGPSFLCRLPKQPLQRNSVFILHICLAFFSSVSASDYLDCFVWYVQSEEPASRTDAPDLGATGHLGAGPTSTPGSQVPLPIHETCQVWSWCSAQKHAWLLFSFIVSFRGRRCWPLAQGHVAM